MSDVLDAAKRVLDLDTKAEDARRAYEGDGKEEVDDLLYAASLNADLQRDIACEEAAPRLAKFAQLVDDLTTEYAKGPSLRASFARDLRRALGLPEVAPHPTEGTVGR